MRIIPVLVLNGKKQERKATITKKNYKKNTDRIQTLHTGLPHDIAQILKWQFVLVLFLSIHLSVSLSSAFPVHGEKHM